MGGDRGGTLQSLVVAVLELRLEGKKRLAVASVVSSCNLS